MYTIMLLDDEPLLLEGLAETIDWAAAGFQVIATARHGLEGIERYIDCQPDVVLTDIRMRFMDGLDFIREIRRLNDQAEVLVMSAYNNFEYAQTACALGASDYLLKPIQPGLLEAALSKIRDRLDQRYSLSKRLSMVESLYVERRESLTQMAKRRLVLQKTGREELNYVLPELAGGLIRFRVLLSLNGDAERAGLLSAPIADMLADAFSEETWFSAVLDSGVICTVLREGRPEADVRLMVQSTLDKVKRLLGIPVAAVLGPVVDDPAKLHGAYREAEEQLRVAMMMGAWGLTDTRRLPSLPVDYAARTELKVRLLALIPDGTRGQIDEWVDLLVLRAASGGLFFPSEARILTLQLLARLMELRGISQGNYALWADKLEAVMHLNEANIPCELGQLIHALIEEGLRTRDGSIGRYISALTAETMQYIRAHLSDPELNLTSASAGLHVSAGYLGRVFKRASGKSFATHLSEARLERAKALLSQPGAKINDVSLEVGYQNLSYFIVLFKKKYGVTPGEYRARMGRAEVGE